MCRSLQHWVCVSIYLAPRNPTLGKAGVQGIAFEDLNEKGAQEAAGPSKKYAKNADFQALVIKVDIADEASVQSMVDQVVKE